MSWCGLHEAKYLSINICIYMNIYVYRQIDRWNGLDWIRLDQIRLDQIRLRLDKIRLDKIRLDRQIDRYTFPIQLS